MVKTLHRAGIEVILDVVYNHTGEGNHLGPDAVASAASTTRPTTGSIAGRPALLRGLHRLRQHASTCCTRARMQLIMDSLRYWVQRDARRRLPLRPGARCSRASCTTSNPLRHVLRHHPARTRSLSQVKLIAEPWDVGPGRLPGRQVPGRLGRVERQVPRQRAPLLARRRRASVGELASRLAGSQRPLRGERPRPVREHQLRHLPRRLHARTTSSATSRSTTRRTARTTATATTTT